MTSIFLTINENLSFDKLKALAKKILKSTFPQPVVPTIPTTEPLEISIFRFLDIGSILRISVKIIYFDSIIEFVGSEVVTVNSGIGWISKEIDHIMVEYWFSIVRGASNDVIIL